MAIEKIPPIPDYIIDAVDQRSLVLFIGAGISSLAGLPKWADLASLLIDKCCKNKYLSAQDCELIKSSKKDSKTLITIAYEIFKEAKQEPKFWNELKKFLKPTRISDEAKEVFEIIKKLDALVLTTNADKLMHPYFQKEIIAYSFTSKKNKLLKWFERGPGLIHLHGCIDDTESMVFTSSQYLNRYSDDDFRDYLTRVINYNTTVLFIGYSLSEFELMELIIPRLIKQKEQKNSIYILNGYWEYEAPIERNMCLYYESIGIKQLSYSRNDKDYNQIVDVLKNWMDEIERRSSLPSSRLNQVNSYLNIYPKNNSDRKAELLQLLSESDIVERYFFNSLPESPNSIEWFLAIKDSVFFNPENRYKSSIIVKSGDETTWKGVPWPALLAFQTVFTKTENNSELDIMAESLIESIIKSVILNKDKASNFIVNNIIGKILFRLSDKNFSSNLLDFLLILMENPYSNFDWFLLNMTIENNKILQWSELNLKYLFTKVFHYYFSNRKSNSYYEYEFNKITEMFSDSISAKIPEHIFQIVYEIVKLEDESVYWDIGAIEQFPGPNSDDLDLDKSLIIWLKAAIKHIPYPELEIYIAENINSKIPVLRKLSVYAINCRYGETKELLWSLPTNPFDDWEKYSDLYALLENHSGDFCEMECEVIIRWLRETNFDIKAGANDDFLICCKFEMFNSVAKTHLQYMEEASRLNIALCPTLVSPFDRNKHFRMSTYWETKNIEIVRTMKELESEELVQYISNAKNNLELGSYELNSAFIKVLKEKPDLILENVEPFYNLPNDYYQAIITVISSFANDKDVSQKLNPLYKFIARMICIDKKDVNVIASLAESINQRYSSTELNHNEWFEILLNLFNVAKEKYHEIRIEEEQDVVVKLLGNWFSRLIISMIEFSANSNNVLIHQSIKNIVLDLINTHLEKDWQIKPILSYKVRHLMVIDEEWTHEQLPVIFNCAYKNFNPCVITVFYQTFKSPRLYEVIQSINGFAQILDLDNSKDIHELHEIQSQIAIWCTSMYIDKDGIDELLMKMIHDGKHGLFYNCFSFMVNYYLNADSIHEKSKIERKTDDLCKLLLNIDVLSGVATDQTLRYLMKCIDTFSTVSSTVWQYANKLCMGFKHYFSDDMGTALLNKLDSNPEEVLSFLMELTLYGEDWAFSHEDKLELVLDSVIKMQKYRRELRIICNNLINRGLTHYAKFIDLT